MTAEATKTKNGKVDWKTVRGLMVDAIYGGRVDNPHDMRVLATYLRRYFNSDVVSMAYCLATKPPAFLCPFSTPTRFESRGSSLCVGGSAALVL